MEQSVQINKLKKLLDVMEKKNNKTHAKESIVAQMEFVLMENANAIMAIREIIVKIWILVMADLALIMELALMANALATKVGQAKIVRNRTIKTTTKILVKI